MALLIPLFVIVLFVVLAVLGGRARRRRSEAMEQVAAQHGFRFEGDGDLARLRNVADLWLFQHGSGRARNVMTGTIDGVAVTLLDFSYSTGGKQQHVTAQAVALFPEAGRGLPDMTLRPQRALDTVGRLLGAQDIDFPSHQEFSRNYLLRGPSEAAIRAALSDDTLAWFGGQQPWAVEVVAGTVAVYRPNDLRAPQEMMGFAGEACAVLRALAPTA